MNYKFKGTKGKWLIDYPIIYIDGFFKTYIMSVPHTYTDNMSRANILLASKAPEMFDLLKDIYFGSDGNDINYWKDKIEQLLKEATTL